MAKKAKEIKDQVVSVKNPIKKLEYRMEIIKCEEFSSQQIWFRMDEMRDIVNQTEGVIINKKRQEAIDRLKEISGKTKGTICAWYNPVDVQVLLDVVGEDELGE